MLEGGTEVMSDRIDKRIVEMSFENHKFEKGIHQSKNSLKDFSNALEKMGTGKDFSGLENSVQTVSRHFSLLEEIGVGALRRIGETAINAGSSLVKSLTVDQLTAGLNKYQQKIEAVQTMVAAGYDLEQVEESMERLMWFSDETSYSFADMAGNMSKFIAAGVDLEVSEKAMKGIATWAAHSGKNSQAASIAMFNLSQAISLGYVDTMNWRSIMGQNMNTKMFKEIAIGVGEATGAIKEGQITIQNFDTNLRDKWFTNDLLLRTLEQYSGYADKVKEVQEEMGLDTAQQAMDYMDAHAEKYASVLNTIGKGAFKAAQESKSFMDSINATMDAVSTGWMRTYEIIFGTLHEAIDNFSALTEVLWTVFAASGDVRNEMLQLIKDGGGVKQLFQILKNVAVVLLTPLKAISEAFDQFFPPKTADQWLNIITILENVTKKMIITEATADKIRRTFAGFFAVIDIGWDTVKFFGSALYEIVNAFIPLTGGLFETTATIGDFLVKLNQIIKQSGVFRYGLVGVKIAAILLNNILTTIISKVSTFARALWTTDKPLEFLGLTVRNVFSGILDGLKGLTTWLATKFSTAMTSVSKFFTTKFNIENAGVLGGILTILKDFIKFLSEEAIDVLKDFGLTLVDLDFNKIATFVTGGILLLFINQLSNLSRAMANLVGSTNTFVSGLSRKLFGTTTKIKDLAYVFGILSASLFVLSKVPWDEMKVGLTGMAAALGMFVVAYGSIQAITVASSKALKGVDIVKSTFSLTNIALGVAIMAFALSKISKIDEDRVWGSVAVVAAMMGLLTAYQALSALISTIPKQGKVSVHFMSMTFGILGLTAIVALLGAIPESVLKNGIGKLFTAVVLITAIQTLFAVASRIGKGYKLSLNLLGLAGGLLGLLAVLKLLTLVTASDITSGIKNVFLLGGVITVLQLMLNLAGRAGGGVKFKTNIFAMQMGIVSMIAIVAILCKMKQTELQNGISAITKMVGLIAALEILTAVAAKIGSGSKLQRILGSVALTMLSFTMLLGILKFYTPETINHGLLTITKMLGIILAFQTLSALAAGLNGGIANMTGLLAMVSAILAVTTSLILLSIIDQTALRKASTSLAITIVAFGIMSAGIGIMAKQLSLLAPSIGGIVPMIAKILQGLLGLGIIILGTVALLQIVKLATPLIDSISWESLGKFALGMGFVTSLITAFGLLASAPGIKGGVASLAGLAPGLVGVAAAVLATAGLFVVLSNILPMVERINWNSLDKFMLGLGLITAMVVGMALMSPAFAILGAAFVPAIAGIVGAIIGVGLIVGAFIGLAALMELLFSNGTDFILKGIDKLVLIGEGIGRFVGSLVGGFNAEAMIGYGKGLAGFTDAIKGVDSKAFDGVESLARALLILTGSALIDGIARFVNSKKNPGEVFGEQLQGLLTAFEGISVGAATHASDVIGALAPMAENLKKLAEASGAIPNTGGLLGFLMGNNDIDKFGEMLESFITGFLTITVWATTHAAEVITAAAPMAASLKSLARAAGNIPNTGGFLEAFMGGNDIDVFGAMLTNFVRIFTRLQPAAVTQATTTLDSMTPMISSLKAFSELANDLPDSGGMVTWFAGDNDIKTFVSKIIKFVTSLSDMNVEDVNKSNSIIRSMNREMLPGLERFANLANTIQAAGGDALVDLARNLKDFVKTLKGVDVSIVGPALKSLEDISDSFKVIGAEVLTNALASFQNNKRPFQQGLVILLDEIVSLVGGKKIELEKGFTGIISNALTQSRKYVGQFNILGADLMKGLQNGIEANTEVAGKAIVKMSNTVIRDAKDRFQVKSPSKVFSDIGGWLGLGLAKGIERNSKVAILASANMAEGIEEAVRDTLDVHSDSEKFIGIGKWAGDSLGKGWESAKAGVMTIAGDFGVDVGDITLAGITESVTGGEGVVTSGINSLLEILTGSTSVTDAMNSMGANSGEDIINGMASSISDSSSKIAGATKSVAEDAYTVFKRYIDDLKEYHLISFGEELAEWENFAKKYAVGTRTRIKADDELNRLNFTHSKSWIEKEKYYKRLSLLAELSAWERVQARYAEGHEYRMEAERELFRLKEEIRQAEYRAASDWIDEEKYYGRLNITGELKAWKLIQERYEDGSDERKQANREVFRLEEDIRKATIEHTNKIQEIEDIRNEKRLQAEDEYYNKTKQVQDKLEQDIQSLTNEYDNAVNSRAQSLYSAWGLFDEVELPRIDGRRLLRNLGQQVQAFDQWQAQIGALADKGVNEGLIAELTAMGPSAANQIAALNDLSEEELEQYVGLWEQKSESAREQAISELSDMKDDTVYQIAQLITAADEELIEYEKIWKESLKVINEEADSKLEELEANWLNSMQDMTDGGLTIMEGFKEAWLKDLGELVANTTKEVNKLKELTSSVGTITAAKTVVATTQPIAVKLQPATTSMATEAVKSGEAVTAGMARGMMSNVKLVEDATVKVGETSLKSLNSTMMIKSPSEKTIETGKYFIEGLVEGLQRFSGLVTRASMNVGQSAMDALNLSMSGVPELTSDMDETFTITPILDLTNVKSGMDSIKNLLGRSTDLNLENKGLGALLSKAQVLQAREAMARTISTDNSTNTIQITNHFSVRNDSDIRKVSNELKKTFDRYNNAKGVAVQ